MSPVPGVTSAIPERRPYPSARAMDGEARSILFDASKCIGCRQCVEACKDWHDLPRGDTYRIGDSTWITMEPPVPEGLARIWGRNSCMHCDYPSCAAVCPVEAITKFEEGPVVINQAACIGCEYCVHACPWHVIAMSNVTKRAIKCTMCNDRLGQGASPFCVQACPVDALDFGPAAEMEARADTRAAEIGGSVYGREQAGGTRVLHVLVGSAAEHGLPSVDSRRYPVHQIPWSAKIKGLLTVRGDLRGRWRAIENAWSKPWRLAYRYWQWWHRHGQR